MKVWVLLPHSNLPVGDDPWDPWYDKSFGFVIIAETEESARALAQENAGDEKRGEFLGKFTARTHTPWLEEKYSSCKELTAAGELRIILQDFHAA